MDKVYSAEKIQSLLQPLIDKGFSFRYTYEKGGDSSCVYICRFQKGKDFFDWRETSGVWEIHFVAFVGGEYRFPSLKTQYKSECRAFALKHLFKKATVDETREFYAQLLLKTLDSGNDFYGIQLWKNPVAECSATGFRL